MRHLSTIRVILIVLYMFQASCEDWIKIPQVSDEKKTNKLSDRSTTLSLGGVLKADELKPTVDISKPNQAWLDYQLERFGLSLKPTNQTTVLTNINKFVVTDRMDSLNKGQSTTYQFHVPLKVYDTIHDNDEDYDSEIGLSWGSSSTKTPLSAAATTSILHHRNKLQVVAFKKDPHEHQYDDLTIEESEDAKGTTTEADISKPSTVTDETKLSAFQKFLGYIKSFQSDFLTKTSMNIQEKIKYLNRFKDHLLFEIEDRIKSLWRPEIDGAEKETESNGRSKRDVFPDDTFMSFPSTEGALITINFLTFAVFLIKLVLQVISTLKSKHYTYNGLSVNTMEAIKYGKHRSTRSYSQPNDKLLREETIQSDQILKLIDSFEEKIKFR